MATSKYIIIEMQNGYVENRARPYDTREDAEDFAGAVEASCGRDRQTQAAYEIMRQVKNELKDRGFMTLALRLAEAQDMLCEKEAG